MLSSDLALQMVELRKQLDILPCREGEAEMEVLSEALSAMVPDFDDRHDLLETAGAVFTNR